MSTKSSMLFKGLTLSLIFLSQLPMAMAQNGDYRYYDIELIIFENLENIRQPKELSRVYPPLELPENVVQLELPVTPPTDMSGIEPNYYFRKLTAEQLQLGDSVEKLTANSNYRVLLHFGWRQPGLAREQSRPVLIQRTFSPELTLEPPPADTLQTVPSEIITEPMLPYQESRLSGLINVSLSRYLHLDLDLNYELDGVLLPQATTEQADSPEEQETTSDITSLPKNLIYKLKQSRRLRSKELHYIDHPLLGIIVLMTPVEMTATP